MSSKHNSDEPSTSEQTAKVTGVVGETPPVLSRHGYHVDVTIGTGTYSIVKKAFSDSHKQDIAIKIITKARVPAHYLQKFVPREIEVVRGLKHPNIIRFFEAIETTHRVYIIMELAENGSLLELIRKQTHLDEDTARRFFSQIMDAIEYCYFKGVVHRDIKCENLLLDRHCCIKLSDFGFAKGGMAPVDGVPVESNSFCGSYAYASPEVLTGKRHDPYASDHWSAGVVLYCMVFGGMPFSHRDVRQLVKDVQRPVRFPRAPPVSAQFKCLIQGIVCKKEDRLSVEQIREHPWMKMSNKQDPLR